MKQPPPAERIWLAEVGRDSRAKEADCLVDNGREAADEGRETVGAARAAAADEGRETVGAGRVRAAADAGRGGREPARMEFRRRRGEERVPVPVGTLDYCSSSSAVVVFMARPGGLCSQWSKKELVAA